MIANALFLAACGVAASFAPREILIAMGSQAAWSEVLVVQVAVALVKAVAAGHRPPVVVAAAFIHLAFAASFAVVLFTSPVGASRHE